jgi:malonyl-CoA/methylmalonyl-CoA synthetase
MTAGAVTVLLSPKLAMNELEHIANDAAPRVVFSDSSCPMPTELLGVVPLRQRYDAHPESFRSLAVDDSPALILYTSGTTGPPKGAIITRQNIAANLDALKKIWEWTDRDTVVHSLPWIHVHGLVLGLFGSLRVGGALHHVPRFTPQGIATALNDSRHEQTLLFAVPTMYHRLAEAAASDTALVEALKRPRLLISGSAGLPLREHELILRLTGRGVHERYGLTETLINCGVPASQAPMPGFVGPPLPGVELVLVDDQRRRIEADDEETIGEVAVRSPAVFAGYLNRPDATSEVLDEHGWFYTGDLAIRAQDGSIRILGRRSTDLIKTGGYRVGAGEIESCLLGHPDVAEAAVVGAPDEDLGQRIVAFVVLRSGSGIDRVGPLVDFAAKRLSSHKRPRDIRVIDKLPRNAMGKVQKKQLLDAWPLRRQR